MIPPTLYSFDELRHAVDRALLFGILGLENSLNYYIDEFLADDPHVIMLLTWLEMRNA